MYGYGNSMFLATHGILARTASGGGIDPDAQAFITAASITDPTQQSAINQLVVDLKGYNIWTKMKALYPFVGGTAAQHKWNLKDPRDLNAAFRLVFNGGWTHSSTGALPNGTNAYADTKFSPNNFTATTNSSAGVYLRTNALETSVDLGQGYIAFGQDGVVIYPRYSSNQYAGCCNGNSFNGASNANTDSRGLFVVTRTGTSQSFRKRGTSTIDSTITNTTNTLYLNYNIYLGAGNNAVTNTVTQYSTRQQAFAFIGDYLTSAEIDNLYTAVQAFQTTLGRSIGTQTVSDADAQAFVTNAGIVDQVEANAINNLVIGLKADGLWSKIYATYPLVGGTSTTMKYNLKNPLDTDAAFRAVFSGGWTYSNNGILGNGANSFADTKFNPTTIGVTKSNFGVSVYSRTNTSGYKVDIGAVDTPGSYVWIVPRFDSVTDFAGSFDDSNFNGNYLTNTLGLISVVRDSATTQKLYQAGVQKGTRTAFNATGNINQNIYFGARNNVGVAANYTDRQYSLIAIHEGFNATEMTNFNTRVTTFQTALNRNV